MRTKDKGQTTEAREQAKKMSGFYLLMACLIFSILCLLVAYAGGDDKNQQFQFRKDQQIQQIKPKKPVKIKLHRNAKGEYSWDLTGDSVDDIVNADRRLRKLLKIE